MGEAGLGSDNHDKEKRRKLEVGSDTSHMKKGLQNNTQVVKPREIGKFISTGESGEGSR